MKYIFQPFNAFPFIYCDGLLFDCMEGMGLLPLATKMIAFCLQIRQRGTMQAFLHKPVLIHLMLGTLFFSRKSKSQILCSVHPRCHFRNNSCFKALASALILTFRTQTTLFLQRSHKKIKGLLQNLA